MKYHPISAPIVILAAFLILGGSITGCIPSVNGGSTTIPGSSCGNGTCDSGESLLLCSSDCQQAGDQGQMVTASIHSEGIGDIAVRISAPKNGRFPEGAGVIVVIPPIFTEKGGFPTDPDVLSIGLIEVTFLWPGQTDPGTGAISSGIFDSGGEQSTQVMRDVIRFASGLITDLEGRTISSLIHAKPLTDEVGLYAFSDAGIAAVNVLSIYGELLPGVQYLVGNENPTVDVLAGLEAGYMDDSGEPIYNPFYNYPASYTPSSIDLNYSNIRWDATYTDTRTDFVGRAYFDLDGSNDITATDLVLNWKVPVILGKRYYSVALTQALFENGALSLSNWPVDLATPEEAARDWPYRQSPSRYVDLRSKMPDLKVMLVFAQNDHAQAAQDKPHIHQAFQGFRFESRLWVRMNPDRAYMQASIPSAGDEYPDNPANTQPDDWLQIGAYAYPRQVSSASGVPLAALAEMADRTHFGRWDENLGQVLYIYFPPTEQP
jgi:hypothetical protein